MAPYADLETASDDYASRFAGPVGSWFLEHQLKTLLAVLPPSISTLQGVTLLDVGGGHGQLAGRLLERGCNVTVLGSDARCEARLLTLRANPHYSFAVGEFLPLPFDSASFDIVVSVRLLPHFERWDELLRECCRVARKVVVIDYPTSQSLNALTPLLFKAKKGIEKNTRPYTLFTHAEIRAAFDRCEFLVSAKVPQFFVPMVLHRAVRSAYFSKVVEHFATLSGLTKRYGSPIMVSAVPRGGARQGNSRS